MKASWVTIGLLTAAFVLVQGCAPAPTQPPPGPRSMPDQFVGVWEGQRDAAGKCSFAAWRAKHYPNGYFEIAFYSDAARSNKTDSESGRWWVQDDAIYMHTLGTATPDRYSYVVIDPNTVRFTSTKRDKSADCQADYEFTDHRVASLESSGEEVNAFWNFDKKDMRVGFWLYKTKGSCPSLRVERPLVFAPQSGTVGAAAEELRIPSMRYCFAFRENFTLNRCQSGKISYRYVPELKRYEGTYEIAFVDGDRWSGMFVADFCAGSE